MDKEQGMVEDMVVCIQVDIPDKDNHNYNFVVEDNNYYFYLIQLIISIIN